MVEADSPLKLLPASILNIYKVSEHIDMLSIGIQLLKRLLMLKSMISIFTNYETVYSSIG
jgi:hypothetical protein